MTKILSWLALVAAIHRARAGYPVPSASAYCLDGCLISLTQVSFGGEPVAAAYSPWLSKIRLHSIFLCGKTFCSSDELRSGYDFFVAECVFDQGSNLLPDYEVITNITQQELEAAPRIAQSEGLKTGTYNTTIIPTKDWFELGYWTTARFQDSTLHNKAYGRAMYGFWGGVMLLGMAHRLLTYLLARRNDKAAGYTEEEGVTQHQANDTTHPSYLRKYARWVDRNVIVPATFGTRCRQPAGWCTLPPRLESLTIFLFVAMNIVLCAPSYYLFPGNIYYPSTQLQLWRYLSDRTGVLAFANLPLLWLFGMRNNVFLWLTGWSFATYNSFHRWTARVATLEAVLHSVFYTVFSFKEGGLADYAESFTEQYWYTGVVATCAMAILLGFSVHGLRKHFYEIFLYVHIALAVIVLVGCFYHVKIFLGEYDGYLWPCVAIWCADRLVRILRVALLNSKSTVKGEKCVATYFREANIVRLDVSVWLATRPTPGTYYFLYTPATLKGWESHPFTLANWESVGEMYHLPSSRNESEPSSPETSEFEKATETVHTRADISSSDYSATLSDRNTIGAGLYNLTFMIRPYHGFTARLRDSIMRKDVEANQAISMPVMAEGPYGGNAHLERFDSVIFIMGGSGITVAIPYIRCLVRKYTSTTRIRLVWSAREMPFVQHVLHDQLNSILSSSNSHVSVDVYITQLNEAKEQAIQEEKQSPDFSPTELVSYNYDRPNIDAIINEAARSESGSVAVMMSGPAQMADDTRAAVVAAIGTSGRQVKYFEEVFGW